MSKRIAMVTGAAGFIGSHLVDHLLAQGYHVIGVDHLGLGKEEFLASAKQSSDFELFVFDLAKPSKGWPKLCSDPIDVVWHLAANSDIPAGNRDPKVDHQHTFLTTFYTIEWMEAHNIKEIVFASSSAIYGEHEEPLKEDTGPLFPISNYGAMKLASEGIITSAAERFLNHCWLFRFPNVVGSRATHGVLYDFNKKLKDNSETLKVLGDGNQKKPYCHVSDLVEAMWFGYRESREQINCFNIGTSLTHTSVKFIAEQFAGAFEKKNGVLPQLSYTGGKKGWVGDVAEFKYSTEKINALGWKPKMSSDDAIRKAIEEILEE